VQYAGRSLLLSMLGLIAACKPAQGAPAAAAPAREPTPAAISGKPPADAVTTPSGLAFVVLQAGSGDEKPELHDKVRVEFIAWSTKGPFDSRKKNGGTDVFEMKGVIAGWTEALRAMRVGERRRLWIPDELAYPGLRANPTLSVFEVELLEILRGQPPLPAPPDVAAAPADATRTSSGLAYKLLTRGGGSDKPNAWDRVKLHYTGWTSDGALLESSSGSGKPAIFDVAEAMPGWQEALPLMAAGDRARLWIPASLAQRGRADVSRADVVYDLELVSIERKPEPPRAPASLAAPPADAKWTESGLAYRFERKRAAGAKPTRSDRVVVSYSAWTTDGQRFDSSLLRGKPASLPVNGLIPGWAEGLQLMAEGDRATFWIPEKLAYAGEPGSPRGMLVYEVELLDIQAQVRAPR
jgi:FKBP-type peptidyl-prolyl cis-trans isomerase